ncbi:hypothetical protein [Mycobacterium hubeiense]|uniref:hypothetical protein n=1 Tax=Mycobacterium hubeiense TaxID=1867256 RepID=UPI000C7E96B4|nr:hypothetical protein [Mycobacterium sp. QGD 101]
MTSPSHYFTTNLVDAQNNSLPPGQFNTLQSAMLYADERPTEVTGEILYIEDENTSPHPMVHYTDCDVEDVE